MKWLASIVAGTAILVVVLAGPAPAQTSGSEAPTSGIPITESPITETPITAAPRTTPSGGITSDLATKSEVDNAKTIGIIGVIIGALGLIVGVGAIVLSRRRAA
jgi:hypothetical protein